MTKRHYQLFALMILIGGPLLVNLAANAIPGLMPSNAEAAIPVQQDAIRPDPERMPPPAESMDGYQSDEPDYAAGEDGPMSTEPTLDTRGIDVGGGDTGEPQYDGSDSQDASDPQPALDLPSPPPGEGTYDPERPGGRGGRY